MSYRPSHVTAAAIGLSRALQRPSEPVWVSLSFNFPFYTHQTCKTRNFCRITYLKDSRNGILSFRHHLGFYQIIFFSYSILTNYLLQTPTLSHYTKYTYPEIKECMSDLLTLYKTDFNPDTRRFGAVWNKYNLPRLVHVYFTILSLLILRNLINSTP